MSLFTFHYVSIKTLKEAKEYYYPENLHSTMYLLKRVTSSLSFLRRKFTFHYVSIKTKRFCKDENIEDNLHSTMYLLKPVVLNDLILIS